MSSISTTHPFLTAQVTSRRKFFYSKVLIRTSRIPSVCCLYMFVNHLLACCCGSMHRPHLSARVAKMPFSADVLSDGSPFKFQSLIVTGSPRISGREKESEVGIFLFRHSLIQPSVSIFLQSPVNAPKYEMQAHERKTLPTSFLMDSVILPTSSFQRTPSSASMTTSFSARAILLVDQLIWNSVACFFSSKSFCFATNAATLSLMIRTLSNFLFSSV